MHAFRLLGASGMIRAMTWEMPGNGPQPDRPAPRLPSAPPKTPPSIAGRPPESPLPDGAARTPGKGVERRRRTRDARKMVSPRKPWQMRWPFGVMLTLVVLRALVVLGTHQGGPPYTGRDLETDLSRVIGQNGVQVSAVRCPEEISARKGEIVSCRATLDGTPMGIRVTWDDDKGHFHTEHEAQ